MPSRKSRWSKILSLLLTALLIFLLALWLLQGIGLENVQSQIEAWGPYAPIGYILILMISLILAPLSGNALMVTGAVIFPFPQIFIYSYLGSFLGANVNFWLSRKFGRWLLAKIVGYDTLADMDDFLTKFYNHGFWYALLIMPLSSDFVSYALGLTHLTYQKFVLALAIANILIVSLNIFGGDLLKGIL